NSSHDGAYTIPVRRATVAASDCDLSTFNNGTLTINKAHLTVTADDQSRLYGDTNPTFTATISGFKNLETLATSGVTGSADLSTTDRKSGAVGHCDDPPGRGDRGGRNE